MNLQWNLQSTLAKVNYKIYTDAIKNNIVPWLSKPQITFLYANEADLLNIFGITAKQWKQQNPDAKGNMRDEAIIEQLVVLSNLESINALLQIQPKFQKDYFENLMTTMVKAEPCYIKNV